MPPPAAIPVDAALRHRPDRRVPELAPDAPARGIDARRMVGMSCIHAWHVYPPKGGYIHACRPFLGCRYVSGTLAVHQRHISGYFPGIAWAFPNPFWYVSGTLRPSKPFQNAPV